MTRRRILLLRPDNIGDMVLFSGAIRHIREFYADDIITLAVQPHIINLVELCPYVNDIIPVPHLLSWKNIEKGWLFQHYCYRRFRKNIERIKNSLFPKYDMILFPVKSPDMAQLELIFNLSVKRVTGVTGCSINAPLTGFPLHLNPYRLFSDYIDMAGTDPWWHEFAATLDYLRNLGCKVEGVEDLAPEFWVSAVDREYAQWQMGDGAGPVIGLFPGASHATRTWSAENYGPLCRAIATDTKFVIFGGPDDVSLAGDVEAAVGKFIQSDRIINLAGRTTLRQLVGCISRCTLLISMETVALHMGIALGIPTVGIVGGGHYGRFVPWGDPGKNLILTEKMDCFNCNWRCRYENPPCIQKVRPEVVAAAVSGLLETYASRK